MEIKIDNLKIFLKNNGYNWQGYASRPTTNYSRILDEYVFNKATKFYYDIYCGDSEIIVYFYI